MTKHSLAQWFGEAPRWLTWRKVIKPGGKPSKEPDQSTKKKGRTYAEISAVPRGADSGIGFITTGKMQTEWGRLVCLDIDACRDPVSGEITEWAREIIKHYEWTATEITPSGTGLRPWLLVQDELPEAPLVRKAEMPGAPAANVGEKRPEIQIFGLGPAGYVTCTRVGMRGTTDEVLMVQNLDWLLERFNMRRERAPHIEPEGEAPTMAQITETVSRDPIGEQLLRGEWRGAVETGKTASDAFFRLEQMVLRAAQGHTTAATLFLLNHTAWGKGEVDDSRDPSKYGREDWVRADVLRAAEKTSAAMPLPFEKLDSVPTSNGGTVAKNGHPDSSAGAPVTSVVDRLWGRLPAGALEVAPPPRRFLLRFPGDAPTVARGFAPMAIAAVLSSEGGLGKTNLILHLAACVVTGRDWLGYPVDPSQIGRHCCLVLAEEKQDEVLRRLWQIAEHLQLTQDERELVLERVVVLALSGQPCSFTALDGDGIPRRTGNFRAFLSRLASGPEWALVALDPLARLFPSAESSNELATYAVQCVEAISEAPGCPLALLSHHSSKIARRLGGVDARGVTGLTDGARWALTLLSKEDAQVELRQSKANYSPQQEKPLLLQREPGGLLRLSTAQEAEEKVAAAQDTAQTGLQKDAEKVVRYLRANGTMPLRLLAVKLAMGKARAGAALDEALRLHWITRHRAGPATGYTVASDLELDLYGFENGGFQ